MLAENDKAYITEAVMKQLAQRGNPREVLTGPFLGTTFSIDLNQGNVRELAFDAVRLCIRDGWNNNPTWMELLLDIFQLRIMDGKVNEIWERSKIKSPDVIDPLSLNVINGSTIFLNRRSLRSILTTLETNSGNTQPILNVSGGVQHGKSYSTNYIDHFSNVRSFIPCKLVFDPEMGTVTGPADVARDLVSLMGKSVDTIPPADTNMKLYTRKLAHWVLNQATQISAHNCWIILDNFQGDALRADTANFIVELSEVVTNGIFMARCRLILIGFDITQLLVNPGKIVRDVVSICTSSDIQSAIQEILGRATQTVDFDRIHALICNDIPTDTTKMAVINRRLQSLLDAVNALSEILAETPTVNYEEFLVEILSGLTDERTRWHELQGRLDALRTVI